MKDSIGKLRDSVSDDIWSMTRQVELLKEEEWMADVEDRMKRFELDIIKAMIQALVTGK